MATATSPTVGAGFSVPATWAPTRAATYDAGLSPVATSSAASPTQSRAGGGNVAAAAVAHLERSLRDHQERRRDTGVEVRRRARIYRCTDEFECVISGRRAEVVADGDDLVGGKLGHSGGDELQDQERPRGAVFPVDAGTLAFADVDRVAQAETRISAVLPRDQDRVSLG
jgi:hypothetical protein